MRRLDATTFLAGQIDSSDLAEAATANVKVVVNHRTQGEDPAQPPQDRLAEMIATAGMRYWEIPVSGLPDEAAVHRTLEAMNSLSPGEGILLFCRSGMRSAAAWAMAERLRGANADDLRATALAAGYDLSRLPL